jgi:hypothetical protein
MALTSVQLAVLRDEVTNDPKARGYGQFLPHAPGRVVDLLNEQSDTMLGPLHSTTAQAWAATGPMAGIVDAGLKTDHPCRASCLLVQLSLSAASDIHLERADVQSMFDRWLQSGVITQEWHDDLFVRAQQPASRLRVLGLPNIDVYDLIKAGLTQ